MKSSPALRALYNNLKKATEATERVDGAAEAQGETGDPVLDLAVELDAEVKRVRPDSWRGVRSREQVIKFALFKILNDEAEVERIFPIIKAQSEY